jgi:hypothetical protein
MPAAPTIPHPPDRTGQPVRPAPHDPTAQIAALYPAGAQAAQHAFACAAAGAVAAAGRTARTGSMAVHATAEARAGDGWLVLVPMAGLADLDVALAIEDDADPAVWHVMARDGSGRLLEPMTGAHGCPSVLWAVRAGIDPSAAVGLVDAALADPLVRSLLGLRTNR